VLLAGFIWATGTAASDDGAQTPAPSDLPSLEASSADAKPGEPDPVEPETPSTTPREASPSVLPKRLAPRTAPPVDVSIPPSAATKPALKPKDGEAKKPRKPSDPLEIRDEGNFNARLGSQSARGGGVLGRYDGVMASKALGDAASFNLVGGFPLASSSDARCDLTRSFYALSLELTPFDEKVAGKIFGVQQRVSEELERNAIGGELRFDHERLFGLATVDYDVDVREVGMITLLASARLDARTTLNAFVDARRSSAPTAYAPIQGQSVRSVEQLLDRLSQSEIRAPLLDSPVQARTFTLGASRLLTSRLELAADVTLKDLVAKSMLATAVGVPPDPQIDYSVRATWKDFLISRSSTTAGVQIAEMADFRRYAASLGGRYPILQNFRVGPDLSLEYGEIEERWTYKPSLRFEYLQSRLRLDFQLGLEISEIGAGAEPGERRGVFYSVGYRYDF
jgi:hypothetical protein